LYYLNCELKCQKLVFEDTSAIWLGCRNGNSKAARYYKSVELLEIVEILMEDESDEELEELNELIEDSQNASSSPSSSDEEGIEIEFYHRRETDTANIHVFTGL